MKPDPNKVIGMRMGSYDKLNDKGFVPEETVLVNGDIILGKVTPIQDVAGSNKQFKDNSEVYKSHAPGVVDRVYTDIKNQDGYETRKVLVRSQREPRIGDKFCIPETANAEILTNKGWINLKQLYEDYTNNKTYKIASLESDTKLKYVDPIDVYEFGYMGDIYKLRSQQVDLDVTMDHELYVRRGNSKFEMISAENIMGKKYHVKKDCINNKPDILTFDEIKELKLDMNEWLKLFGIWIAEGWTQRNIKDKYIRVEICQVKPRVKTIIQEIIKTLGFHSFLNSDKTKIIIHHKNLAEYLETYSVGAVNKFLPEWVWNLSQNQSRILAEYMMLGDGSSNNSGSLCYYTSSKKLANDFQRLCIHAGWSGSIKLIRPAGSSSTMKDGRVLTSTCDALSVRVNKTKNEPEINHSHVKTQSGQSEEKYYYNGKVYCLEVPSHVFMMRQNGKNVWIGNCSRHGQKGTCGILLRNPDMPFTKNGIRPDIIVNANAIPSRMTMGQLIESLIGKVAALDGHDADGTPFNDYDLDYVEKRLEQLGYDSKGYEEMYNGMTGEKLKVKIFIGPTYYMRLKHLVEDKLHSRARGPVTLLTRRNEVASVNIKKIFASPIAKGNINKLREHL